MPKYYWRARGDASKINPGWRVPIAKPRQTPAEALFESVRRKEFPQRPSRLKCVFVCPDLKWFCGLGNHDWDTEEPEYIFEVKVTGKTFKADAELFTSARDETPDYAESIVRSYWKGEGNPYITEILVDGTVTIVRRIQPPPVEKRASAVAQRYIDAGGHKTLFYIGKRPAKPQPKTTYMEAQPGASWQRSWLPHDVQVGVFLTDGPLAVALNHAIRGHVYAYRVPQWVIREAGGIHRTDEGREILIPECLWNHVDFLGKSKDATTFNQEIEDAQGQTQVHDRAVELGDSLMVQRQLKQASGKVIVVDVQPAYRRTISDPESTMKFLNGASQILGLYNGPDLGYEDEEGVLEWWIEHGFDPEKQYDVTWDEKGYGFFRDWMDGGMDYESIAEVVRYMIDNSIHDSRDLDMDALKKELGADLAEEVEDVQEYGGIGIPDIDFRTLQRFNGATIIGGGCDECLAEVEILLNALGLNYRKNMRYVYAALSNVFDLLTSAFDNHPTFSAIREPDRILVYTNSPLMAKDDTFQRSVKAVILSLRKMPASQELNDYHITQVLRRDDGTRQIELIPEKGRSNPVFDSRPNTADLPNDALTVDYIYQPRSKPYQLLVTAIFQKGRMTKVLHQKQGKTRELRAIGSKSLRPATNQEIRNAKPSKYR